MVMEGVGLASFLVWLVLVIHPLKLILANMEVYGNRSNMCGRGLLFVHVAIVEICDAELTTTWQIDTADSSDLLYSFANNLDLCGPVTGHPCPGSPPFSPPPPFVPPPPVSSPGGNSATGAIAGGVAAGAALLFAAPAMAFAWWRRRKPQEYFFDVPAEEDPEVHLGQLKRFSLRELQVATDTFSNKNILGRGGFGKVYKGRLADGTLVAVKRLKEERTPGGELQFQTEVEMISMAVHKNLLRLRGFCMTPTERLLVYPYMANGSVASCLRERPPSEPPLAWPKRKGIALGSARGLSYLHDHCDPKIIHRDVKAANILLDEEFEAVVGDFGLARLMDYKDTHVTTAVRGTIGHIAPEYLSTGKSSEKTDVFGYGIMLLELITGQRAFDLARLANDDDVMLLDWVKGLLKEKKLELLVDPDLQNEYVEAEVEQLIQVALLCTQGSPMDRPKMSEVVRMLEGDGLAERWDEWQKVEVLRQEVDLAPYPSSDWLVDSTDNLHAVELSGPRSISEAGDEHDPAQVQDYWKARNQKLRYHRKKENLMAVAPSFSNSSSSSDNAEAGKGSISGAETFPTLGRKDAFGTSGKSHGSKSASESDGSLAVCPEAEYNGSYFSLGRANLDPLTNCVGPFWQT
ncbi:hypothetical protein RJ639_042025 [Escallonia herrerae]|uniref:non-specific serine/threonine protein kinase n=1 Tax=Escallonia herrerae TaxID=1293975 RepID=A0AA88WQ48_9ASTE|nr:hypothetical protein RJ639_042025 [Escallonia herrerae]